MQAGPGASESWHCTSFPQRWGFRRTLFLNSMETQTCPKVFPRWVFDFSLPEFKQIFYWHVDTCKLLSKKDRERPGTRSFGVSRQATHRQDCTFKLVVANNCNMSRSSVHIPFIWTDSQNVADDLCESSQAYRDGLYSLSQWESGVRFLTLCCYRGVPLCRVVLLGDAQRRYALFFWTRTMKRR